MRWPMIRAMVATILLLGFAAVARSTEAPSPTPSPSDLTTVHIDAIATDRRGRPVTTLKPADFQLRIDGAPHAVGAVDLPRAGRVIGILLDAYHLPAGAAADRARAALLTFASRGIRPGDHLFIVEPPTSLTRLAPVADAAVVSRVLEQLSGREGDYTPRTDFERKFIGRQTEAVRTARTRITISALEALATALGRNPGEGRRSLIFVSVGRLDGSPDAQKRGIDAVLRAANRFDVAIYPIDPTETDAQTASPFLRALAVRSGGRLIAGADLDAGLSQMASDADAFYRLTFQAPQADGQFHDVAIAVKRRGVEVRSRTGYWVPSSEEIDLLETAARLRQPPPPLPAIRPAHTTGLIESWLGIVPGPNGEARVTFTWQPDPNAQVSRLDGAAASVTLSAKTLKGDRVYEGTVAPASDGGAGKDQALAVFDAPPGTIELQMAISAADGKSLGADVRHLAIPRLDASRTMLGTPEILRTRTARELADTVNRADAAPAAGREFSQAEQLLIRVPAYAPDGHPVVSAQLLNVSGAPIETLTPMPRSPTPGVTQFLVTLAAFPPGSYTLELKATSVSGEVGTLVPFRIGN